MTDIDMVIFIESAIRGGLSQVCSLRHSQANNKYMPNFDKTKPSKCILYFAVNNLYACAQCEKLPTGGFSG